MVLVDPARRGQGGGTALMRHARAFLDERKVQTVRLDATPLGRPIYEKLGFVAQYQLTRYEGIPSATAREGAGAVEPLSSEQAPALLELDRAVTRTNRSKFLLRLLEENPDAARVVRRAGRSAGYIMARPGARAVMIGPCIADAAAGPLLFADAWQRYSGQAVFVDIPVANTAATRSAEAQALTVQRPLLRMCRGEMVEERIEELWASSGPELG
jgi:GNAT superfamily N-acetyltransferase